MMIADLACSLSCRSPIARSSKAVSGRIIWSLILGITSDGSFSFRTEGVYQSLGAGESVTETFSYTVRDSGGLEDTALAEITVTGINGAPVTSPSFNSSVADNMLGSIQIVVSDVEEGPLSYSIAGGADASFFEIGAETGVQSFLAAPDFEAPGDAGGNNLYDVTVDVSDGDLNDAQDVTVQVTDTDGLRDSLHILDYEIGVDSIELSGASIRSFSVFDARLYLRVENADRDATFVSDVFETEDLTFSDGTILA